MKGLVGGIPLALLVAAVAAVANGHGEAGQEEGPVTLISGPSGDDGGNSAAIGFDSSYSSSVKDTYKDDHSIDLKNTVVAPAPPHPPMPGFRKRGDPAVTFVKGPSGDDGGNSAGFEFDSAFSSVVEDWVKDDHSADIKNTVVTPPPPPPPFHGFRRRGDSSVTFVKGPSGNDGGNSAEIEFDRSYASAVEDWYKDDHSLDEENHIISPPPMPGFRRRGDPSVTLVKGPSGNDGGNSAEIEFDSSYASAVEDWYKDDHSVDIDNHIVQPPTVPGFRKRGDPSVTFVKGPSGNDGGNSAGFEFDSSYASSGKDWYKDDHSVDIKNHVIQPPPVPGFRKRGGGDTVLIDGPSGNDGGNSAGFEFDSSYTSSVKDAYKDDHSVDVKNTIIHPPPVFHPPPVPGFHKRGGGDTTLFDGPSGNDGGNSAEVEFESAYVTSVKDYYKDDHSVDIQNHVIHPPPVFHPPPVPGFRKRGGGDTVLIDGPSGNDGGNSASFEFDSAYASSVKDAYKDDHSVDVKNTIIHPPPVFHPPPVPGFRKRDDGGSHISTPHYHEHANPAVVEDFGKPAKDSGITLIKGPSGNDGGNSADTEFDNNYASAVEDHYKDDHSVDIKNHVVAPPAVPKGFRKRGSGPVFFDGPSGDDEGNDADFVFDDDYSTKVDSHYADDHSVKEENWIVQAPPPPPPRPQGPPPQAAPPPFAGNPEPPHPAAPVTSEPCSTSTFLETIIKTLADEPVPTKPATPYRPPEHPQPHVPQPNAPSDPTHGFEPTHPAQAVPTGVPPTHEVEAPKGQENPGGHQPEPTAPSYQPHQPQDADPKEAPKHAPTAVEPLTSITSTITVSHTSSFAVVPVYMDSNHKASCTSADHQRPSDVDAQDNHHAPSSAASQAVKPSHHAAVSPSPSQSMLFTGAAGRIAPAAGVVSAVCGLMAVLAFVL